MTHILLDALRNTVLISGLVLVMMMLIESLNISTRGNFFSGLQKSRPGQVFISALLGIVPGCLGGFASVSLYTHGIISFGALVAMMIASSGDEAFVMLAMMPDKAWWIFLLLFGLSITIGLLIDVFYKSDKTQVGKQCDPSFVIHDEEEKHSGRHFSFRRVLMFIGVAAFIAALLMGLLEHDHGHCEAHHATHSGGINLLSEEWTYWLFGALSLIVLTVLIFADDHFIDEHLWKHIIVKHFPSICLWTFGVLLLLGFGLQHLDIASWINSNIALMIVIAALVGIIPESGPHLLFVTLYASGIVPLPVLLASCISQDGHASIPLIAENKSAFLKAKVINVIVAIAVGFVALLF